MDRYSLELPGHRAQEPEFRPVVCPFDRETIAEVEFANEEALTHALTAARRTQDETWRRTPAWKRAEILRAVAGKIRGRRDNLAMLIASEGGKPLKDALVEADRAAITLEECASAALALEGEEVGMQRAPGTENRLAFTIREPMGVVLAICAFNHPLNLACHQAGAALAAGNTCVLKPATSTPICSIVLGRLFRECGLPEGVFQVVPTPGRRANLLVESPLGLGQGNVISGIFSNSLSLAFKIERGEIVGRVKEVSIAGNIYEDLRHVEALSQETEWVYGGLRLPYVLLPALNVVTKTGE